jgi:hypothetical protein
MKTVVGLFDSFDDAQQTVNELETYGISRGQISVLAKDGNADLDTTHEEHALEVSDSAATGAATGAVAGTAIGGTVGLLAGLTTLAIPGFGPLVAAGPLIATITGAGLGAAAGAATGGLIGALAEIGVPADEAGYYEEGVRRGSTLVTVSCHDGEENLVVDAMNRHHVVDIHRRGQEYREAGYGGRSGYSGSAMGVGRDYSDTNAATGYSGLTRESRLGTGASVNRDEEIGADADYSGFGAAANHGYIGRDTESRPASTTREPAGVAHGEMATRDNMKSSGPNAEMMDDDELDEEALGDTDRDLKRPGMDGTNVY